MKPDRVIFNALINACGQSGAVDRAFDVLAEMMAEPTPMEPDHVTIGALMRTCAKAGQASLLISEIIELMSYLSISLIIYKHISHAARESLTTL